MVFKSIAKFARPNLYNIKKNVYNDNKHFHLFLLISFFKLNYIILIRCLMLNKLV